MTTPLRVCVLQSSYEGSSSEIKEWDDCLCTPAYHFKDPNYQFTSVKIKKAQAYQDIRQLVLSGKYDLFFNLCDGAKDEDRAGVQVAQALEEMNVPFTGAPTRYFEPSKIHMKMVAHSLGIKIPAYCLVRRMEDLEWALDNQELNFPVIVKHANGYSSIGMSKKSKCVNADEVRNEVEFLLTQWGEVLVEEFIQGREVTVLVSEDQRTQGIGGTKVYPPIEVKFPEGEDFKHFEVKWVNYEGMLWQKLSDEHLAEVCGEVSRRAFQAILGGISYGRTDLRVDDKGDVYFLEINPNCGIFYPEELEGSADFILKNDPEGVEGMAKLVMDAAWNRWQLKNKQTSAYEVTFRKSQGFMLRAARDIDEGEKVFDYEERSFHLASKNYIEKNWNQDQIKSFGEYAWPLSPQVFVLWDEDPSFWRPINHSCDPNVWLGENFGLDIFARRKIARGEQLSIDYATFCGGDYFAKFVCQCGSQNCREEVTGVDYTHNSQLRERFGTRVTDFVFRQ